MKSLLRLLLSVGLISVSAEYRVYRYCKDKESPFTASEKTYDQEIRKNKDERVIEAAYDYVLKEISCEGLPEGKALLKYNIGYALFYKIERFAFEVEHLALMNGSKATPFYYGCINVDKQFYFVQERIEGHMLSEEMGGKFRAFLPPKKVFKFLQIAVAVQTFHSKGITHQGIQPRRIASMDPEMADLRLIDLEYTLRIGESGEGMSSYFHSPDKLKKSFAANSRQDAFALAITIAVLLDPDQKFLNGIEDECPSYREELVEVCKTVFVKNFEVLSAGSQLSELLSYLRDHLFSEKEPLDIQKMIEEMIRIYTDLLSKYPEHRVLLDEDIESIKDRFQVNLKSIEASSSIQNII